MEKKKILHVVEAFGGGIFSFLVDLVNNSIDEYDIFIAYSLREQTPKNFKEYFNKQVHFVEIKNFTRNVSLKKDIKAFFEVKRIIKQINPDIIHLHSSKAGFVGRFAADDKRIKILYNPHGFSFLMKNNSKIKRFMYWCIEKFSAIRKCTIIGCSKGEYEQALKLSKNSIWIDNGVNVEKLKIETAMLKDKEINLNDLKICTSGRIGYQKNPKLFNQIAEKFPNLKFTWIGEGELRNTLNCDNIEITGWKNRQEVLELVNQNDIFILTSLWEGLPIALLEAMFLKKICIVTDCIGNRDVIENGTNGFVCKNIENFEKIINKLLKDEIQLDSIKNQAYLDIINKYNVSNMVNKYKKKYEEEI